MALISCPECGARISELAVSCPNCGFTVSSPDALVPLGTLPPVQVSVTMPMPDLAIFDDGSDLVPTDTKTKVAKLFKNAEEVARLAPGIYDAITKAMETRGTVWAATFSAAAEKMMKEGELVLSVERNTGEFLPQLRDVKTGKIYEKARLRAEQLPNDAAASLASLQTQLMVADLMREIKSIAASVEQLRLESRGDRMARAESVWLRLEQAMAIEDCRLREQALLAIAQDATEQRCIFQKNFSIQLEFASGKAGSSKNRGEAARDALVNLSVITLMARSEYAANQLLGLEGPARVAVGQLSGFIMENRLNERDTLLSINSRSNENLELLINGFSEVSRTIVALEASQQEGRALIEGEDGYGNEKRLPE